MRRIRYSLKVLATVVSLFLFTGVSVSLFSQPGFGSKMPATAFDYKNASQKQLKEEIKNNPGNIKARVRLLMSVFRSQQMLTARQHYDSIMDIMYLNRLDKKEGKDFEAALGVKKSDLLALENRFTLVGKEMLRINEARLAAGENTNYSQLFEAFVLFPKAAETKRELLKHVIEHFEKKAEAAFFDDQVNPDHFKWNHNIMMKLIPLYFIDGQLEKAAEACMRALDYAKDEMEESYITSIFDRCSNATVIDP